MFMKVDFPLPEAPTTAVKDPAEAAWGDAGADVVIESTGVFLTIPKNEAHLRAAYDVLRGVRA